jgi:hypothetical protein
MGDDPRLAKVRKLLNLGEAPSAHVGEARNALSSAARILEGLMDEAVPRAPAPVPAPPSPANVGAVPDHAAYARGYEDGRRQRQVDEVHAARRAGVPPVDPWAASSSYGATPTPQSWSEPPRWPSPPMIVPATNLGSAPPLALPPHRCVCGFQWYGSPGGPAYLHAHSCARCGAAG